MWKRHLFFFFERLEIRAGERRAIASVLLLGLALNLAAEHWPSPSTYDADFYKPLIAAFDERNARAAAESARLDSLYQGLERAVGRDGQSAVPRAKDARAPRPSLPSKPIPINTATLAQLDQLPGIGPAIAQRIIDYRTQHGPFTTVDDLTKVKGIGPVLMEKIRPFVICC